MAANIGTVSLDGLFDEDEMYTFLVSGTVLSTDVGKAVTLDTTAANTVKLAGDGEKIIGRLESYENRKTEANATGTVAIGGGLRFKVNPDVVASPGDEIPTIGDFLVGSTSNAAEKGFVQKAQSTDHPKRWIVVQDNRVSDGYVVAIEL